MGENEHICMYGWVPLLFPFNFHNIVNWLLVQLGFLGSSDGKASAYNAGDKGSIPGLGRSSGEGNGSPLQYSCLENPMDGGGWWATVYGVAKNRTWLSALMSRHIVSSVAQLCLTLCNPMDCNTPGLPVHQQLLEFTQTNVHWVSDAIQPSHFLSSPSPPTLNLSQHQGLFRWVSSHQVAKVLEFQLQHQSFQWIFRTDFLQDGLVGSPSRPRDSQESYPTPVFKSINSSVLSFLYSPTLTSLHDYWKNHSFD